MLVYVQYLLPVHLQRMLTAAVHTNARQHPLHRMTPFFTPALQLTLVVHAIQSPSRPQWLSLLLALPSHLGQPSSSAAIAPSGYCCSFIACYFKLLRNNAVACTRPSWHVPFDSCVAGKSVVFLDMVGLQCQASCGLVLGALQLEQVPSAVT